MQFYDSVEWMVVWGVRCVISLGADFVVKARQARGRVDAKSCIPSKSEIGG